MYRITGMFREIKLETGIFRDIKNNRDIRRDKIGKGI